MKINFVSDDPNRVVEVIEAINEVERENWKDGVTVTWDGIDEDGVITPRMMNDQYTCIVPEGYQYLLTDYEKSTMI